MEMTFTEDQKASGGGWYSITQDGSNRLLSTRHPVLRRFSAITSCGALSQGSGTCLVVIPNPAPLPQGYCLVPLLLILEPWLPLPLIVCFLQLLRTLTLRLLKLLCHAEHVLDSLLNPLSALAFPRAVRLSHIKIYGFFYIFLFWLS